MSNAVTNEDDLFKPGISQEVELTTITITNNVDKNLNIDVIARYLEMNRFIIGVGNDAIEKGIFHKKIKKPYKRRVTVVNDRKIKSQRKQPANPERINKNKTKKDFYNQVTLITAPNGVPDEIEIDSLVDKKNKIKKTDINIINVKLFNNGRIVMVGCKSTEEACKAGNEVVKIINTNPSGHIIYKISDTIAKDYDEKEIVKFLTTYFGPLKAILDYAKSEASKSETFKILLSNDENIVELFNIDLPETIKELRSYIVVKKKGRFTKYPKNQKKPNEIPSEALKETNEDVDKDANKYTDKDANKDTDKDSEIEDSEDSKKKMDPHKQKLIMSLIKIYNVLNIYYNSDDISSLLSSNHSSTVQMFFKIISSYSYNKLTIEGEFPAFVDDLILYDGNRLKIHMIESCFKLNFNVNRANVQQILNNKHGLVSTYNSDSYQGVNCKYISKIGCTATEHNMCTCKKAEKKKKQCKCPCTCKEISNLIFRKGAIIITGAISWEQVLDCYHHISGILIGEYDNIVSKQNDPIPKRLSKTVNTFTKEGFTYILPAHIKSNQKNQYLIEKYGFDHLKSQQ